MSTTIIEPGTVAPTGTPYTAPAPRLGEPGDHDRFAHYVKTDGLTEAYVMGTPVEALCGKVWVPSRDPQRFPVCPTCKEIIDALTEAGLA